MSPHGTNIENAEQRAKSGVTVTFCNASGELLTGHRTGKPREAVKALCAAALALDPTYRVLSYSTPQTIYQDLRGRTRALGGEALNPTMHVPERHVLASAGLYHLLHPSLRRADRSSTAKRREMLDEW